MNLKFELLDDKGDVPSAIKYPLCNGYSQKPFWVKGGCGLTNFVISLFYLTTILIKKHRNIRLRTKKIDAPKVNESVRLTTGLTLSNY